MKIIKHETRNFVMEFHPKEKKVHRDLITIGNAKAGWGICLYGRDISEFLCGITDLCRKIRSQDGIKTE